MKSRGILLKNTAALFMLLALLSLLLPFCKVTTPDKSTNISGFDILTASAHTGYEYYKNGSIDDHYVIKGNLTWGDLKSGINYAKDQQNVKQAEQAIAISLLPILLCGLAMIISLLSAGKASMFLSTLLIAMPFVENIFLIARFQEVQNQIFANLASSGIQLGLLIGIYAFTALCGLSLCILLFGWFTASFSKLKEEDDDSDRNRKDRRNRRNKRGRRGKKHKKKTKTKKKKSKDSKRSKDNSNDKENSKEDKNQQESMNFPEAEGKIKGSSGIFQGIDLNLATQEKQSVILGTTKDTVHAAEFIASEGQHFVIEYDKAGKSYKITSHSNANIVVCTHDGTQHLLANGKKETVGGKSVMYVGNTVNKIHLI